MSTIVVGVDGSPSSIAALRWALGEAAVRNAEVRAVQAWSHPFLTSPLGVVEPALDAEALAAIAGAARERLEAALVEAGASESGIEVEALVKEGAPAPVLLEAARDAELLVVGSRGLGGFAGLLLGSVGRHCVEHASCPVVILRGDHPPAG
jgi:nucleotide-binding universal stress UspA family protein